jgi:tetratricopeptide (TPR) repeat protein
MATLSLAMITKNEAEHLAHCLESVRDLVDEVVVVDTGSTDGTVAIAEAFGARIGRFQWCDDFAAARNASLSLCTGDWVLSLDADEAIDSLDHRKIRQVVDRPVGKGKQDPQGFLLLSRNYFMESLARVFDQQAQPNRSPYREGFQFPYYADVRIFRLFRRLPHIRFEGRIHERADTFLERRRLPIGRLDAVIHHYGKLDLEGERAKRAYYLELAERDAAEVPGDANRQFNVMAQADLLQQWDKVLVAGLAVMKLERRGVPPAVPLTVANAYQQKGMHDKALSLLQQVVRNQPTHPQAVHGLASSLRALGRGEEARPYLERACAVHPANPLICIALSFQEEVAGRLREARTHLRASIEGNPRDLNLRQILINLDLRHGLAAQAAADAMEALRALPGEGGGLWHALAAGFLLKEGHLGPGKAVLDLGLAAFPENEDLRKLAAALPPSP